MGDFMDKNKVYELPSNALLTAQQAADYPNIKVESLYNMVQKGKLLPRRLGEGKKARLRFTKTELEKLMV